MYERATLEAVERSGREALTEAQWLLGVLHAAEHDESAPAPGLAAFAEPFEPARAAGIRTVVTVTGDVRPLSADPELAAATGAEAVPGAVDRSLLRCGAVRWPYWWSWSGLCRWRGRPPAAVPPLFAG